VVEPFARTVGWVVRMMTKQGSGNVKTSLTEGGKAVIRNRNSSIFAPNFADSIVFPTSLGLMERTSAHHDSRIDEGAVEEKIKHQVFEKVRRSMIELGLEKGGSLPPVNTRNPLMSS
jgi:hypothetical protein